MYTKQGLGKNDIAANLFEAKIPIPSEYKNKVEKPQCKWRGEVVTKILTRLEYAGHTVHRYSYVACHKSGRRMYLPPEERQITYNTHEAIIDPRTFEAAQSLHNKRRDPLLKIQTIYPYTPGFFFG